MKKIFILVLSAMLATASCQVSINGATNDKVLEVIQYLGILNGDENGDLNLDQPVTRAEFAKMLVSASNYMDGISTTGTTSSFYDVKYTHWAASYIRLSVNEGWFKGYLDGTFRPNNTIVLEEGITAMLRVLGYTSDQLIGTYPSAWLNKYIILGMNENMSANQGDVLTRRDCVQLFYNMLGSENINGMVYGSTIGLTMDEDNQVDYFSMVNEETIGPIVIESDQWKTTLPFDLDQATIYKNNELTTQGKLVAYDVIYYNENMKTIWAYNEPVIGIITDLLPDATSPSEITVNNNTYALGTSDSIDKVSSAGIYNMGDTVALLLGMEGEIVDIINADLIDQTTYGIVSAQNVSTYLNMNGKAVITKTMTVIATDGKEYEYPYEDTSIYVGEVVSVSYHMGEITIGKTENKTLVGTVNETGTRIGAYTLADDAQIIDVNTTFDYQVVYPQRLAGTELSLYNVKFYALNAQYEIEYLILYDATGDLATYGLITSSRERDKDEVADGESVHGTYDYIVDEKTGVYTTTGSILDTDLSGAQFNYVNGSLISLKLLKEVEVSNMTSRTITGDGVVYDMAQNVIVYYKVNNNYYITELTAVSDLTQYDVYAYYDNGHTFGKQIRVICAVKKD